MHEVVNPDDVRMGQLKAALRLTLQLTQGGGIANNQIRKKLKGNLAFQFFIARQPHDSHSAAAQNLDQGVAAEEFLTAGKLTLRHVRGAAGSFPAHAVRILLQETVIKAK